MFGGSRETMSDLQLEGGGVAEVGSIVRVRWLDEAGEDEYTIVSPHEADFRRSLVSALSPFAEAVLGRKVGETVTVQMARRASRAEILSISWPQVAAAVIDLRPA